MNCFEWQSRSSDYLDGALIGSLKSEADSHVESCEACAEKQKRYRMIISTISSRPRAQLPIPVRKAPLTAGLPRLELRTSRWAALPWYLRTSIEAAGIILLTLTGISLGPKMRSLYERKIENNLSDLSQPFSEAKTETTSPAGTSMAQAPIEATAPEDEFSNEGEDDSPDSESATPEESIQVGKSDVWRFIIKTDSLGEMRSKVITLLNELKPTEDPQSTDGIRAPGGIQFDLILPQSAVARVKTQLTDLAPPPPEGLADTPAGETFTWYKVKSKRKLPDGKTRVVIWISQM